MDELNAKIFQWVESQSRLKKTVIVVLLLGLSVPMYGFPLLIIFPFWIYKRRGFQPIMGRLQNRFLVKYLTGIPTLKKSISLCTLFIEDDGIRIKAGFQQVSLPFSHIIKVSADTRTQINRQLSMGKGALGLIALGPIGAMLGAGMGTKHDDSKVFITIEYKDELNENTAILLEARGIGASGYQISSVIHEARKAYLLKYNINPLENKTYKEIDIPRDNIDQIEKLAQLKDKEIITEEEFNEKKKHLLSKI